METTERKIVPIVSCRFSGSPNNSTSYMTVRWINEAY
uniref:Uncharacterized protein n=1 Tax=Rhizophora mucronata TaxID=61149 RepID=A0A2P2JPY0_RHIMU